jgi:hypothetical protein
MDEARLQASWSGNTLPHSPNGCWGNEQRVALVAAAEQHALRARFSRRGLG